MTLVKASDVGAKWQELAVLLYVGQLLIMAWCVSRDLR
jgi:hypothetical protein